MNAPPLVFGGWSPVVAYLRDSMMVWLTLSMVNTPGMWMLTVFPEPLYPTIRVRGV